MAGKVDNPVVMFKPYKYVKEDPSKARKSSGVVIRLPKPKFPAAAVRKGASVLLVGGGVFLVTSQLLLPWLTTPPAQGPVLKPVSPVLGVDKIMLEQSFVKVEFEFSELAQSPGPRPVAPRAENIPKIFYLTIPKLGIERAEVDTNSESLSPDERLGHYPGSALPGEVGNPFVYGHSVLPMFFNPKDYKTIFSTLDKLEEGDKIVIDFGKRSFMYLVEKSVVLAPEDVRPLESPAPSFLQESYLTLMTCVPPGVRTNRLLVQAKLSL